MENNIINTKGGGSGSRSGEISDDHGSDREVDVGQGTAAMRDDEEANVRATNTVIGGGTRGDGGNSSTSSARGQPHASVCGGSDDGLSVGRGNAWHGAAFSLATNDRRGSVSPTELARCVEAIRPNRLVSFLLLLGSAVLVHAPLSLGPTSPELLEPQAAEAGGIQDGNGGGDGGDSSDGDADQHAAELRAAEEGSTQDENGIGGGDSIGNGDDAHRRLYLRLRELLFLLVLEVLRLATLYYVKTVFLEDSLCLFDVLQLCVGIVAIVVSIAIECLRGRGVMTDAEADLLFTRSRSVMRFAALLLSLLILLC